MENHGEIVLYRPDDEIKLEVRLEEETVWLNRQQMAELFARDVKTIGKHVNNALKEELAGIPVVAKFATTAADGKTYQVEYYNLDMILSVGYRVKSRDTMEQVRVPIGEVAAHIEEKIDFFVRTSLPPVEGVFCDGQIFDAYKFAVDLIRSARKSILLIDNYVDESVLLMLSKRRPGVTADVYTAAIGRGLQLDARKLAEQYPRVALHTYKKSHDRFLILDRTDVYHIGASLKDLGKKIFAFSKLDIPATAITDLL